MKELYLLRHAESTANERGILQGRKDYPLSHRGVEQARILGGVLSCLGVDVVYSSPAGRVAATLAPAIEQGLPNPVIINELDEIDLGSAAGLTFTEFHRKYGREIDSTLYCRGDYRFPEGESRRDLYERASVTAEKILTRKWKRALITSHGGILSQFLTFVLGIRFDGWIRFRLDNAALARLVWHDDRPYLACFNNIEHLSAELRSPPFAPLMFDRG
ncbi:histidine phosphatase family protein [bacterium]|nr:histidine phosphatase family protein [bacterium]